MRESTCSSSASLSQARRSFRVSGEFPASSDLRTEVLLIKVRRPLLPTREGACFVSAFLFYLKHRSLPGACKTLCYYCMTAQDVTPLLHDGFSCQCLVFPSIIASVSDVSLLLLRRLRQFVISCFVRSLIFLQRERERELPVAVTCLSHTT